MTPPPTAERIDLPALAGTWHVVATPLPFWRGRRDPRIRYTPRPDGAWLDEVLFTLPGDAAARERSIVGVDRPDGPPGAFRWRQTPASWGHS